MHAAPDLRAQFIRFHRACLSREEHIAAPLVARGYAAYARQNDASDRVEPYGAANDQVQFQRDYFDNVDQTAEYPFEMIRLDKSRGNSFPAIFRTIMA